MSCCRRPLPTKPNTPKYYWVCAVPRLARRYAINLMGPSRDMARLDSHKGSVARGRGGVTWSTFQSEG
jgi:hypothetical protein